MHLFLNAIINSIKGNRQIEVGVSITPDFWDRDKTVRNPLNQIKLVLLNVPSMWDALRDTERKICQKIHQAAHGFAFLIIPVSYSAILNRKKWSIVPLISGVKISLKELAQ